MGVYLPWGVYLPNGGVPALGGVYLPRGYLPRYPPDRILETRYLKYYLVPTSLRAVTNKNKTNKQKNPHRFTIQNAIWMRKKLDDSLIPLNLEALASR